MPTQWEQTNNECKATQDLLSAYAGGALSARQAIEIEKHLTSCQECGNQAREMQTLLETLQSAARHDTADDFMARLHARLDTVEPEAMRPRSRFVAFREWIQAVIATPRRHPLPALGMSMAAIALFAIMLSQTPASAPIVSDPTNSPVKITTVDPLRRNVALTAEDPFADPAAANLEAHSEADENNPVHDTDESNS